ncbi:MAG: phospholipase D-like domain-containing protein [Planctomycetota bacterium]
MLRDHVQDLLQRVPLLPESEARLRLARAGWTQREHDAAGRGLNIQPGEEDDGWRSPDPVTLGDGTRLQLYKDGEAAQAAIRAIEKAQHRILLEVYIWPGDETGRRFSELLAQRASEGVRVFVIYDGFGCLLTSRSIFDTMSRAGANVVEFHPLNPWRTRWGWRPANRDHRKLLVVDDDVAGIGGLNIGNRYAGQWVAPEAEVDPETMWRDAGVGIVGPSAGMFAEAFANTWRYTVRRGPIRRTLFSRHLDLAKPAKGRRLGKSREIGTPEPDEGPTGVLKHGRDLGCLASAPTLSSPLRPFLQQMISQARQSILLTVAYFAPDDALLEALSAAAARGVKVRLMLAGRSDVKLLVLAGRAFYKRLLDAGCEIWERQHAMLHQKSIVVDGELVVLGSTNLDYRSIEFNLELSAVVRSEAFAGHVASMFRHDREFARKIHASSWRRRPFRDKAIQWLVSRLRYTL